MKTLMNKAHILAKTFDGHYHACLKLALKILWSIKKNRSVKTENVQRVAPTETFQRVEKNTIKNSVKTLVKKTKNFFLKILDK